MTTEQPTTIKLAFERATKNTVRYQQVNAKNEPLSVEDGAVVPTLYVQKSAFKGEAPMVLSVTLHAGK